MTRTARFLTQIALTFGLGATTLLWTGDVPHIGQLSFVTSAEARVGRPRTPMSYAGVARRTTRRAVAVGAGAVAVGAASATRCYQVVDHYGRISTVCR